VKRRSLLLLLAGSAACSSKPEPKPTFARQLLDVVESDEALAPQRAARTVEELARLAAEVSGELERAPHRSRASILTELMFGRWGFVREVESTSLAFVLLPSVLERRRGNCVGLGTLFLALADALGWSASGVLAPGHFYVRSQEPAGARNVELLRAGESMPDAWYAGRFPIPGGAAREYARPLTAREVLGVVEYDIGSERRRQLSLPRARAALQRAVAAFPDLSEAHASLGAVEHLLGNLSAAAASYERARAANPHLPGLGNNEALLAAERKNLTDG
jgi:regulator of sirC expression with transglutaminase-like and TPR domain